MDSMVEATSLAFITEVASSPPQRPELPVAGPAQPLVLYIARVPGSRDVFLTPMKPREKVVSAEDVQSSLYYVHVNCEDDHQLLATRSPTSANADASQLYPISENIGKRKLMLPPRQSEPAPLPYPVDDLMPALSGSTPGQPKPLNFPRKPVMRDMTNGEHPPPPPPHLDLPELPPRRVLPTPPNGQPQRRSLHAENVRLLRQADHSDENNPYSRQYPEAANAVIAEELQHIEAGSLTLIRRDPSSSEQWNVASIHDPPVHEVSSSAFLNPTASKRTKRGGAPLYLDITNPGYLQFLDKDRPLSRTSTSTSSSNGCDPPPEGTFRRRLYMPGSQYADHGYGHRRIKSETSRSSGDMARTMRDRTLADLNGSSTPKVDFRSKGYSFTSPWDGKCEFTTGATGKSLKCRHTVPHLGTVEVSELRFNLPTSSRGTQTGPANGSDKRSSYFSRHSRFLSSEDGSRSPTFVINDEGRVDLTLGQEKAGGGFGGKQAKLGKLIIEPEGLKMLDLLVAASIGLWWRAYERL
jgi:hypothetical protein